MSKKIEAFWGNATAEDVAEMMKGKTVEARFRDHLQDDWCKHIWNLAGYDSTEENSWIDNTGCPWRYCQVYREPSWWTDKPDPGPGFRLLEKFPPEAKLGTDEYWSGEGWMPAGSRDNNQHEEVWYRRRIEPVSKFAVGQMVKVVGPKGKPARHWAESMDEHIGTVGSVKIPPLQDPEGMFYNIGQIVNWAFREDYLEAVEAVEKKPLLIRRWTVDPGDEIKLPNGRLLIINQDGFEVAQ
jgi:hypothetical protein